MQATRIIAVRHGETAWNVDTRIQGQLDIPLNDNGRWQAQRLARALAASEQIDAIYTTPATCCAPGTPPSRLARPRGCRR